MKFGGRTAVTSGPYRDAMSTVLVAGAGVVGLTSAIRLLEAGHDVRVVARDIPGLTSRAAGASWGPYLVGPWAAVRRWSAVSLDVLHGLATDPATGVNLTSGLELTEHPGELPPWADLVPNVREARPDELPPGAPAGLRYTVPLVDMAVHLEWLLSRVRQLGGTVEHGELTALAATGADVVVNCTGSGSATLAADPAVVPVRGQVVVAQNPGISEFFIGGKHGGSDLTYWFPHGDRVLLGGTSQAGAASWDPDPATAEAILARVAAMEPRLAGVRVLEHRVGLRPSRPDVRLELEHRPGAAPVVHSYGHGGGGVTLSWGCAADVVTLVGSLT